MHAAANLASTKLPFDEGKLGLSPRPLRHAVDAADFLQVEAVVRGARNTVAGGHRAFTGIYCMLATAVR